MKWPTVLPQAAPSKGVIDAWINSLGDAPPLNYRL
jgi:hypothetical protein